mmetsp:Transcript_32868/g.76745  ORF Transcript_32868/g.76745 Transcript_32868/m.76745 type:complete len:207 (+) Transcript_32868:535-1155(+)
MRGTTDAIHAGAQSCLQAQPRCARGAHRVSGELTTPPTHAQRCRRQRARRAARQRRIGCVARSRHASQGQGDAAWPASQAFAPSSSAKTRGDVHREHPSSGRPNRPPERAPATIATFAMRAMHAQPPHAPTRARRACVRSCVEARTTPPFSPAPHTACCPAPTARATQRRTAFDAGTRAAICASRRTALWSAGRGARGYRDVSHAL